MSKRGKHGRGGMHQAGPMHHQIPPEQMYNGYNNGSYMGGPPMYQGGPPPYANHPGKGHRGGKGYGMKYQDGPPHEMGPFGPMHNGHDPSMGPMGPAGAAGCPPHGMPFGGPPPDIMQDPAIQQVNDMQAPGTMVVNGQYEQVLVRCHGTIDKVMTKKGFGFISCAELHGMHVFFHFSQMLNSDSNSRHSSRDGSEGMMNGNMPSVPPLHCEVQFTLRYTAQDKRAQAFEVIRLEHGTMARLQQEHGYGTINSVATLEKDGTIQTDLPNETFYHSYAYNDYQFNIGYPLELGDIVFFILNKREERFKPTHILVHKKKKPVAAQKTGFQGSRKQSNAGVDEEYSRDSSNGIDSNKRHKGRICSMKDNFGFIKRLENLPEIFFHYSQVSSEVDDLNIEDDVEFSIQMHVEKGQEKGPCAANITKCKERLIFENITHHAYYGCIMATPKVAGNTGSNSRRNSGETTPNGQKPDSPIDAQPLSPDGSVKRNSLAGVIVCKDDNNQNIHYEYHDRERRGNLYTLMLGDPITFQICEDLRTGDKRAVNVMLNHTYFESRGQSINTNIPVDLIKWYIDAMKGEKRERGVVAAVKDGFGFIKCVSHDQRMFFHCNEIIDSTLKIRMKDEVEFTVLEDNLHTEGRCHATRIVKLPRNSVIFHTVQDPVLEGTLHVNVGKIKERMSEGCIPEMCVTYTDSDGQPQRLMVPGINALHTEVRLFLEKVVDCEAKILDLNNVPVHFQIQQSKKNNTQTAVNIHPVQWVEISSSQHQNGDSDKSPKIKIQQNESRRTSGQSHSDLYEDSVFSHGCSQLPYRKTSIDSRSTASRSQRSSVHGGVPPLERSISTSVVDKIMQNSRGSVSSEAQSMGNNNFHTPVKAVKSNPAFLKNEKTHYGYIVTTKDNYGFIESENHEHEVFFHYSEILDKSVLAGTNGRAEQPQNHQSTPGTPKSNKREIKDTGLMRVSNAGYVFGAEVSYVYADKDGKLCAQQVRLLDKGTLTAHEVVGSKLYTGKMTRPCKSVDPNQSLYYGEITVEREASPSDVNCHNEEMRSIQRRKDYSEVARPPIVDGAGILVHDKYPFTINFSTISLADPNSLIAEDDFVVFNVSTNKVTQVNRAVNITAIRAKQQARIESIKGDYGFISYKAEPVRNERRGGPATPSITGNLFFHSSELLGCGIATLLPGDLVEFTVVHSKRTNKYCGAKIRFIERPTSPPEPTNRMSESRVSERGDAFLEQESYPEMQTTELPNLPGGRAMRSPGGFRRVSRNGRTSFSNNFDDSTDLIRSNSVHSNSGAPSSPLANGEARPERIARFKKTSINAESLKNFESQTSRQPQPGNVESKGFALLRQHSSNENPCQLVDTDNLPVPVATATVNEVGAQLEAAALA